MPCKIQIKENVENFVDKYSQRGLSMSLQDANKLASNINAKMKYHVVNFYNDGGKVARTIDVPGELVDRYFDIEVKRRTPVTSNNETINNIPNKFELDVKNLNLTPEVVNYLYQDSRAKSQGRDIENYKREISKIINNLQSDFTNSEILETLKCI